MANQAGLRIEELSELRKFRALIDDVLGNLKRQWQLADEEEEESKRMEMKRQVFEAQDELMECLKKIRESIRAAA